MKRSIAHVACAGAVLVLGVSWIVIGLRPVEEAALIAAVAVASWLFMVMTVAVYKVDYIGEQRNAQLWSGVYLTGCVLVFALVPVGPQAYVALIGLTSLLLVGVLRACFGLWKSPEYTLFWRHATAW